MKATLILAILLSVTLAITLNSDHQGQIFTHQAATNAASIPATTPAPPSPSVTAQPNTPATAPAPAQPSATATSIPTTPSTPSKPTGQNGNSNKKAGTKGKGGKNPNSAKGTTSKPVTPKPAGPFFSKDLTLNFDYATRQQTCFYSAHFQVYWNGKKIIQVIPNDYDVHSLSFKLQANPGKNVLAFQGTGISDGRGATVGNIKLIRKSSFGLQDLVENGEFKEGFGSYSSSKIYKNSIPGWKGKQIEVGKGDFYNKNWNNEVVVTELDANQNTRIEQSFFFLDNYQVFYEVDPKDLTA